MTDMGSYLSLCPKTLQSNVQYNFLLVMTLCFVFWGLAHFENKQHLSEFGTMLILITRMVIGLITIVGVFMHETRTDITLSQGALRTGTAVSESHRS